MYTDPLCIPGKYYLICHYEGERGPVTFTSFGGDLPTAAFQLQILYYWTQNDVLESYPCWIVDVDVLGLLRPLHLRDECPDHHELISGGV